LSKALSSPDGWAAIGGPRAWGKPKIAHTDPTRGNTGLHTLLMLARNYQENHGRAGPLVEETLREPAFAQALRVA
jgi:hypothetical protein